MSVRILYFAWIRERVGRSEEILELPADAATIADVIAFLTTRGVEYENAFAQPQIIRAAINQTHVKCTASIKDAREIAFFPPVTGG